MSQESEAFDFDLGETIHRSISQDVTFWLFSPLIALRLDATSIQRRNALGISFGREYFPTESGTR